MSESVQGQMIGCESSAQLWAHISRLFASRSRARVMQYKLQLQTLKKGAPSMKDYLAKMKGCIDILAAYGHTLTEKDQILHILGGVGMEFDPVVVNITSRVETLTLSEVGAMLLAHEARFEAFNLKIDTTPVVNTATVSTQKKSDAQAQGSLSRGRDRGRGRYFRGGRRPWQNNNGCPICQICGFLGHVAEACYDRFDRDFVPQPRPNGVNRAPQKQHSRNFQQSPPSALTATQSAPMNEDWLFPDSGASHHVTNELGNLSLGSEYSGVGKIHMGNGEGPSHRGSSSQRDFA